MRHRHLWTALAGLLLACASAARASDQAALQFTVPAPDPVQAGDTVLLQALGVNTGSDAWAPGSYYWVAEIYDVDYRFLARTEQISPRDSVAPGAVASVSLPFTVPATAVGKRFYRVFLVKDTRTLIESDYKAFQIVEKEIPPPPEVVDYRVEGNLTVTFRDSSVDRWRKPSGTTALNLVGKIKDSSYLLNANLIHQPGKVVDPYILLFNYYAPWGRIYAGDIAPMLAQLSVNGVGLRGLMLEQQKGRLDWSVLGGQSVTSQPGTASVNGRFARSIYAARLGGQLPGSLKLSANVFQSADEPGSLSTDPKSPNFRGPTLVPQKNSGMGLSLEWKPAAGFSILGDYQKNDFHADTSKPKASDTANRVEVRWERKVFKIKSFMQRAGPKFVAFGAPTVVGDRQTMDLSLGLFPVSWYSLNLAGNQFTDNLANDPKKLTTTQRTINVGNAFQFKTGTNVSLSGSMNTSKGKPATALDNQTTTLGLGVTQAIKSHSVMVGGQTVQFRDKNKLAHDLDTQILSVSANLGLPRNSNGSLGATSSQTKDKVDGSKRASMSTSASYSRPLWPRWVGQLFGTLSQTKNTSPTFPSDSSTLSVNSEFTWARNSQTTLAFGLGYNSTKDKVVAANTLKEAVVSMRYSYSF